MDGEMEMKSDNHLLIHTTYNLKNSKVSLLVVLKTECVLGVSKTEEKSSTVKGS